jgi:LacI family transcriptional regulator
MTTVKEIAELAGVSRGTVDRVLNHRGSVNEETRQRVMKIAESLHYKPNKAALTLASQKKKILIGVILLGETSGNPFFEDVAAGVEYQSTKLKDYGCSIHTIRTGYDAEEQITAIDEMVERGIKGLVITPVDDERLAEKIKQLQQKNIPTITANTDLPDSGRLGYVGSDYYAGGRTAGGLMGLVTMGSGVVGIVSGYKKNQDHQNRVKGFTDVLHESYPQLRVADMKENNDNDVESYIVTKTMLEDHPEITALYYAAAGVAGGMRAAMELSRNELHIISFDEVETTKELVKQGKIAATISQQPFQQGSKPIKMLFDYLATGVKPPEFFYTENSIKIRENIDRPEPAFDEAMLIRAEED